MSLQWFHAIVTERNWTESHRWITRWFYNHFGQCRYCRRNVASISYPKPNILMILCFLCFLRYCTVHGNLNFSRGKLWWTKSPSGTELMKASAGHKNFIFVCIYIAFNHCIVAKTCPTTMFWMVFLAKVDVYSSTFYLMTTKLHVCTAKLSLVLRWWCWWIIWSPICFNHIQVRYSPSA